MDWVRLVQSISDAITVETDHLNLLDSALGDGDHGTSLAAGFAEAARRVAALRSTSPAETLKATASALLNSMGGSSGALYGSLFLRAGSATGQDDLATTEDLARVFRAGLEAVMQRGGAQPGDKTMIDALYPAVDALDHAVSDGRTPADALSEAARAADAGAAATSTMIARHGRAKFVGERSIGHPDAGATSVAIMFQAIARYWKENDHA